MMIIEKRDLDLGMGLKGIESESFDFDLDRGMAQCPVCQAEYVEGQVKNCSTCGWDLLRYPLTLGQVPEAFLEKERAKIAWARQMWTRNQSQLSQFQLKLKRATEEIEQLQAQLERSQQAVDYRKLRDLLAAGKWQEADEETSAVMLKVAGREKEGWLDKEQLDNFPCEDLRLINKLWVEYSKGRFGFSVQKRIWVEVGGKIDSETYRRLGDRLGWRVNGSWLDYQTMTFSLEAPGGHLPSPPAAMWLWATGGGFEGGFLLSLLSRPASPPVAMWLRATGGGFGGGFLLSLLSRPDL